MPKERINNCINNKVQGLSERVEVIQSALNEITEKNEEITRKNEERWGKVDIDLLSLKSVLISMQKQGRVGLLIGALLCITLVIIAFKI